MPQSPAYNLTACGAGKETTFAVPVAPTIWLSNQDMTMTDSNDLLERGSARNQVGQEQAETGAFGGSGSFTAETDPDVMAKLLAWGWGSEAIALNTTSGNPATTTTTTLAAPALAGATTISVTSATGITASSVFTINDYQQEVVTVASISGTTITLSAPLAYPHASGAVFANVSAYDHTFTWGIPRPTFTLQFNRLTDVIAFAGNKIGSMDITLNPRQLVAVRFGTTYATSAVATPGTAAFSIIRPFRVIDPNNVATANGAVSQAAILAASISINTGLQPSEFTLGNGRFIQNIPEAQTRVTGQLTLQFSNNQYQKLFWGNATATGPQSSVTGCSLSIGVKSPTYVNGVVQYGMTIQIPNATITSAPTAGRSGSQLQQTVSFTAYQSVPGANDDAKCVITTASSAAA
ncbi:MAG: hypothetical protein IAI48_00350 [Candidatus Eremiobacteraeota bacterium]|nr:hypothetical protein [Candidatus Eremiobacteraeota bacterium]